MIFRVVESFNAASPGNEVILIRDNWNDWYTWITQFTAVVILKDGQRVSLGYLKVARAGMTSQSATTQLPDNFPSLGEEYFSIGQSENYYETLNSLGSDYRSWFLKAIRDCSYDLNILNRFAGEEVLRRSLLRDIDMERVRNRFNRLAHGNAALSKYAFKYTLPAHPEASEAPPELSFKVMPTSAPATNVHVLIGRNGVGKTRCFDLLARSFLGIPGPAGETDTGKFERQDKSPFILDTKQHGFAGLVTVAFSPFDKYGPLVSSSAKLDVRYAYIGLIKESAEDAPISADEPPLKKGAPTIKSSEELAADFVNSVSVCREGARRERWRRALKVLEADPLFEEANVSCIAEQADDNWPDHAFRLFSRLSSGHSVVLLTITRLVELVEEQSLVLIDEPENHLHPPLLSAFVRALSDLLIERNGVAIVATHSPVVLQEVPRDCVWMLNRSGLEIRADRPDGETFGENVGVLTREVFGLEVVRTGFHRMITEAVKGRSYEQVLDHFSGRLGAEARSIARALTLMSQSEDEEDEDCE